MSTDQTFGAWLKQKRREMGLTQEVLGGLAGCSAVYIRKLEADERQATRQVVEQLLEALQVPKADYAALLQLALAAPPSPSPRPLSKLPVSPTPLIGREQERSALETLLRRETVHLVTLTGPAGTGKTRLSLQVVSDLLDHFPDGVFFVNLAPITDPSLVVSTIAQTLDVRDQGNRPLLDSLKHYLRNRRLLLLLDNFEQVVAAGPLVAELLAAAPRLKVLVTSREVLRLRGEHDFAVAPLALPTRKPLPPLERLTQYAAVQLFIERAQAVKADFAVTNENAPAVAEICHRLDGLPLAIELAAARIRLMPPQALLERLDSRLKVLVGGPRDLLDRHRTLRGTIEWSYDLLIEPEQKLFRRLGVFVGGSTLDAIQSVTRDTWQVAGWAVEGAQVKREGGAVSFPVQEDEADVLEGVASLLDKSLLRRREEGNGEPRFSMLETIREYALERLEASGEGQTTRQQHAAFYLRLAEQAESHLEAIDFYNLGEVAQAQGEYRRATRWFEVCVTLARDIRDMRVLGHALQNLGQIAMAQHDHTRAIPLLRESLLLLKDLGIDSSIVRGLAELAGVAVVENQWTRAARLFSAAEGLRHPAYGPRQAAAIATYDRDVAAVRGV